MGHSMVRRRTVVKKRAYCGLYTSIYVNTILWCITSKGLIYTPLYILIPSCKWGLRCSFSIQHSSLNSILHNLNVTIYEEFGVYVELKKQYFNIFIQSHSPSPFDLCSPLSSAIQYLKRTKINILALQSS